MSSVKHNQIHFTRDENGNVAIIFGLMMMPIMGIMGVAIDYSRALRVQTQLQTTVDAAALAAVAVYSKTGSTTVAEQRLSAFVENALAKDGMTLGGGGEDAVTMTNGSIDPSDSSISPTLSTNMETLILGIVGFNEFNISATAITAVAGAQVSGTKNLELSVVLDVSGSMGDNNKITDMKAAAQDFLDIVMPDDLAVENRKVGLVPFTTRVNAGEFAAAATGLPATRQVQTGTSTTYIFSTTSFSWRTKQNCGNRVQQITAYSSYSQAEAEDYCVANFTKHATQNKWWTPNKETVTTPINETYNLITCVTERQGSDAYTDAAPASGQYVGWNSPSSEEEDQYTEDGVCNSGSTEIPAVKALTTNKQSLKDHIETFTALGWTAGHIATSWAWYMLAPDWTSVFGTDVAEYNDSNTIKAVVIMTDGMFNQSQTDTSASDQARAQCENMKSADKNVVIYTIGFDMAQNADGTPDLDDTAVDLLVDCASPGKYFFPYDGDTLEEAFTEIGNSLVTIVTTSSDDTGVIIKE